MEIGVADKVHGQTVRRILNTAGYHSCNQEKKGLLRAADINAGHDICRNILKRKIYQNIWNNHVAIYLDAKGFQYKSQPLDQAEGTISSCVEEKKWRNKI